MQKVFYGWVIVAVAGVAMAVGAFFATTPFGAFLIPMSRDLGWSMTTLSAAQGVGTLIGGLLAPLAGRLVDRYGARAILTVSGVALGVSGLICAGVREPWQFFVGYGLGRIVFQGFIQIATPTAVANWFVRQRGRATGLALMGNALGVAACVPLIQYLSDTAGWRVAWLVLAAVTLVTLPPLAALFMRRRPEDVGLRPDNDPPTGTAGVSPAPALPAERRSTPPPKPAGTTIPEASFRLGAAMHTHAFWLLLATGSLATFCLAGVTTHQIPLLLRNGVPSETVAAMVSFYALCWTAGGVMWGYVGERIAARYGLAFIYLIAAVGAMMLLLTDSVVGALVFAVLYGVVVGGGGTLEALVWANYFGRANLGTIRGFGRPAYMALNALGPIVAAVIVDQTGSYTWAYAGFTLINLAIAGLVLVARPPQRRPDPSLMAADP